MKTSLSLARILPLLTALVAGPVAQAELIVPGANGTDGALNITANTVIDLSLAPTGTWDQDNTANAGKGVYDPTKWAVVFKYTSVNIAAGATVTFKNHASRAPVVWLVIGDVMIGGTVSLNGQDGQPSPNLAEPGPGGFRGGAGYLPVSARSWGSGFGMGGGRMSLRGDLGWTGYSGSYGTQGYGGPDPYGNASLIPLLGGSGGAGDGDHNYGGGAGGGAILIASKGRISVNGTLRANGGNRTTYSEGAGSGGGIRLVAEQLSGSGQLQASYGGSQFGVAGWGRIRLERVSSDANITVNPDPGIVTLASGATAVLWPSAASPRARIVSVGGAAVGLDPQAAFGTANPDVALAPTSTARVLVETTHVEQTSTVQVRITPRHGANYDVANASVDSILSNDPLTILWAADLPTRAGYSALQVRVVRP